MKQLFALVRSGTGAQAMADLHDQAGTISQPGCEVKAGRLARDGRCRRGVILDYSAKDVETSVE